ncbi:MAG: pteridine reductase [Hydrogenophilales bacterium 16-64-46]|nr:MAG: pteridine reductase [Hydrogenophilales bacterium 12-64-13]OYZ06712.1 MAG: pteridine reductase [Hydrogenophilales bacterium 16-64-46]OZA39420.1 MAG: pteridine reductase [Hydrogenophilales bacterium 17-64-34]HQT00976.1 pteridine reductase [Thiobacillus sp.]
MQGKVVLITGGARRVGAASARLLHAAGAKLMIHYRSSASEARALSAELNALRADSVALIQADLLDIGGLPALVSQTVATFGGLDVLLNNASSFYPTPVGGIQEKDWVDLMGSNLKAPLFLSQAAAHELKKRRGCIINITDIHADRPMKNYVVYSVAKAGLVGLTKSLARELAPEVRVNGIAPGPILWPEDDASFDEVSRQRIVSHTMLKRAGDPNDIALAVRFFAMESGFVTGQILAVDGGRSAKL